MRLFLVLLFMLLVSACSQQTASTVTTLTRTDQENDAHEIQSFVKGFLPDEEASTNEESQVVADGTGTQEMIESDSDKAQQVSTTVNDKPLITLTKSATRKITEFLVGRENFSLIVDLDVVRNCQGCRYTMVLEEPGAKSGFEFFDVNGINVGMRTKYMPYFRGTVLDWTTDQFTGQVGFKFDNPFKDLTLLPEYQEMKAKAISKWKSEKESIRTLDLAKTRKELMTNKRDNAYTSLLLYNTYFGLDGEKEMPAFDPILFELSNTPEMVTHVVVCPEASGQSLIAVFTDGKQGVPLGGYHLFDESGYEVQAYRGANYLDEDHVFADINGDNVIETAQSYLAMVPSDSEDRDEQYNRFFIATVERNPKVLIEVAYDVRGRREQSGMSCTMKKGSGRVDDVLLTKIIDGLPVELARFQWSETALQFTGPTKGQGFVASFGQLSTEEIRNWATRETE